MASMFSREVRHNPPLTFGWAGWVAGCSVSSSSSVGLGAVNLRHSPPSGGYFANALKPEPLLPYALRPTLAYEATDGRRSSISWRVFTGWVKVHVASHRELA